MYNCRSIYMVPCPPDAMNHTANHEADLNILESRHLISNIFSNYLNKLEQHKNLSDQTKSDIANFINDDNINILKHLSTTLLTKRDDPEAAIYVNKLSALTDSLRRKNSANVDMRGPIRYPSIKANWSSKSECILANNTTTEYTKR